MDLPSASWASRGEERRRSDAAAPIIYLVHGAEIMLITCRLKILDFRANDRSLSTSILLVSASCFISRCAAFKNEQWPSPLLPYPLGTQIRKWEGTRQHPISSIGRLDAFASVDVHSHFKIEGDTATNYAS